MMLLPGLDFWWLIPAAVIVDLLAGEFRLPWRHPVCWVGSFINQLEPIARRCGGGRLSGAVCVGIVVFVAGYAVYALISLPGLVGMLFCLYLAYAGLALGGLLQAGEETLEVLENGTLPEAQDALAMLVSRDTSVQDRPTLYKSLADTLSENLTDAIIAPLFWLVVGGPIGLWGYKAVSTFDSMWGYKTAHWRNLGWAGAKLDDLLAYVPARLSVLCLWLADKICRIHASNGGRWPGFAVVAAQAKGMESPNAGWPMAAAAWLLGGRMGGPTVYFGELKEKPWVGPPESEAHPWDAPRIQALCAAVRTAALVGAVLLYALWLAGAAAWYFWVQAPAPQYLQGVPV